MSLFENGSGRWIDRLGEKSNAMGPAALLSFEHLNEVCVSLFCSHPVLTSLLQDVRRHLKRVYILLSMT